VHPGQRLRAIGFVIVCMIGMRLQVEMIQSSPIPQGITGWIKLDAFSRGLIVFNFFIGLFMILAIYSPHTRGPIFLAASLSVFFMALFVSSVFMLI
jgi:hypothetical protein